MQTPRVTRRWSAFLGCAADLQQNVISFGDRIWREYGDYVKDRLLLTTECLFLFHPDAIAHVLQKEYKRYSRDAFILQALKVLVGEGLITSDGDLWRDQRRLVQPFFHRAKINAFIPIIVVEVQRYLDEIESRAGSVVDMVDEMNCLFLSISLRTLFANTHLDVTAFVQALRSLGPDITSYIRLPFPPLAVPTLRNQRVKHNLAVLDSLIAHVIEERKAHPVCGAPDIVQSLIQHNNPQQVRDELITLVIASYQTTSLALSFIWSLLAQHPEAAQKLKDELDMVLGNEGVSLESLAQLEYAKAIFMETVRLYPPSFGIIRQATENDSICGHAVAAGTLVVISPYFTHRHPAFWTDPDCFKPERFLPQGTRPEHKFAYLPFGGGPHMCIGSHLAHIEALIVLAMIAQRYHVRFADPAFRPQVQALSFTTMKELPMIFEKRGNW